MAMSRAWLFRASVVGNLLLLTYVALYSSSTSSETNNPVPIANSFDSSSSSSSSAYHAKVPKNDLGEPQQLTQVQVQEQQSNSLLSSNNNNLNANIIPSEDSGGAGGGGGSGSGGTNAKPEVRSSDGGVVWDGDDSALGEGIAADLVSPPAQEKESLLPSMVEMVNESKPLLDGGRLFPCDDLTPRPHYAQRGAYWVLYNYIRGERSFRCDQSITYSTHADFTFLDNLMPLLERWQGPLSLSVYSPGTDFKETLNRIVYLRECVSPLVKDFVTFHLFFDTRHVPKSKIPVDPLASASNFNCSAPPPIFGDHIVTYKKVRKLPYPVNVARNVAREMATTHYVLPSDIELYPNPNLIPDFLEMIRLNDSNLQRPNPKVFVLSIFEVEANVPRLPQDKVELLQMLSNKSAIPFHKYVCSDCHRIPRAKEWMTTPYTPGLRVFHVGKRHKPFHHWEPIFISDRFPGYDERLSWEGRSDKMTQGYVLCVLDYDFLILDNGFLVHRPGVKRNKILPSKNPVVAKQNSLIARTILPELKLIYGTRPGCVV